jgi:ribosome-binding protein aMBF1 (putative translation factor)
MQGLAELAPRVLPLSIDNWYVIHSLAMTLSDNVSQNILSARQAKKLSQAALAKKAKVSVSYVSMLERGVRVPPLETLETMAKALGVPPLSLLQKPAGKASRRARR